MCRSATPLVTVVVVAATTTALDEIGANIEDQQGHAFDQPSGNANPLLIADKEGPHLLFRSAGADAERLDPMTRLLGLGGFGDKQSLYVTVLKGSDHVLAHGEIADDPLLLPIRRDKADASRLGGAGRARPIGRAGNARCARSFWTKRAIERGALTLQGSGTAAILWCIGFRADFRWLDAPAFNGPGQPTHGRGVAACEGVYFLGLPWLHTWGSGRFSGVGRDALYLADHIEQRLRATRRASHPLRAAG